MLKKGDRVRKPTVESRFSPLIVIENYFKEHEYAFVMEVKEDGYVLVDIEPNSTMSGFFFRKEELELYEEPKKDIVYTREYLQQNEILIDVNTREEHDKLNRLKLTLPYSGAHVPYTYHLKDGHNGGSGYSDQDYYTNHSFYMKWKRITGTEIINSHKQQTNMKEKDNIEGENLKVEPFVIKAENPTLLKAIVEDLKGSGFKCGGIIDNNTRAIYLAYKEPKNKEEYFTLYPSHHDTLMPDWKTFTLPDNYSEAVKFINGQLEDKYWKKEEKNCKWLVGSRNEPITIFKDHIVMRTVEIPISDIRNVYNFYTQQKFGLGGYSVNTLKDIRAFRIGCIEENNLVSLDEMATIIGTAVTL